VEGQWRDFDTTPPSWVELEAKNASPFRALSDLWSRLWFEFNRWRWGQTSLRQYVLWFLGLIMAVLAVQILLRQPWKQSHQGRAQPAARIAWPGLDSEFYLVLERLGAAAPRQSGEALAAWMARLERDGLPAGQVEPVRSMLHLHYRYRFDPQGITPQERAALRQHAQRFLVSLKIEN
jgi:hypothetical protein